MKRITPQTINNFLTYIELTENNPKELRTKVSKFFFDQGFELAMAIRFIDQIVTKDGLKGESSTKLYLRTVEDKQWISVPSDFLYKDAFRAIAGLLNVISQNLIESKLKFENKKYLLDCIQFFTEGNITSDYDSIIYMTEVGIEFDILGDDTYKSNKIITFNSFEKLSELLEVIR